MHLQCIYFKIGPCNFHVEGDPKLDNYTSDLDSNILDKKMSHS